MQYAMIIKQMLDMNKKTFDNSFKSIVAAQENVEKMVQTFMDQSAFFPEEGKKAFWDWVLTYKNGLNEFKMNADKRFDLVLDYVLKAADQMDAAWQAIGESPAAGRWAGKKASTDTRESAAGNMKGTREKSRRKSIKKTNKKN